MNNAKLAFLIVALLFLVLGLIFHPVFTLSVVVLALIAIIYYLLNALSGVFRR